MDRTRNKYPRHYSPNGTKPPPSGSRSYHQVFPYSGNRSRNTSLCQHYQRVTYRRVEHRTNNPPRPDHDDDYCPSTKNRPRPSPRMATRSAPGTRPDYRTYSVYLAETCTLCPTPSNPPGRPNNPYWFRTRLHPCRWLRWSKSNPAAENLGLLFNCSPWVNNFNPAIRSLPDTPGPPNILHHNFLNFPRIQAQ